MIAIAFVHNLLRRHPSCNVLLHKPYVAASVGAGAVTTTPQPTSATAIGSASAAGNTEKRPEEAEHTERPDASKGQEDGSSQQEGNVQVAGQAGGLPIGQDPYNVIEEDPAASRAIESSLWELDSLRDSYCPQVHTQACALHTHLKVHSIWFAVGRSMLCTVWPDCPRCAWTANHIPHISMDAGGCPCNSAG